MSEGNRFVDVRVGPPSPRAVDATNQTLAVERNSAVPDPTAARRPIGGILTASPVGAVLPFAVQDTVIPNGWFG